MRSYGAEIVLAYDPTRVTHLVIDCQLEEPDIVKQALRDRIRIVTIFWVNDVLSKGRLLPPYEILHLPSPFSSDITFSFIKSQIISLTGFEGKERLKVEFLIRQLGASFTDYLEPSNTLLVCKIPEGKKYEMAQLWNIPCVNIRWLQDIYFGDLTALALDLPHKYLSFEPADVTTALDRCTPRVQELMIGWQAPIRLNQDVWNRLNQLSTDFAIEERERKRKLELEVVNQPKVKRAKHLLDPLSDEDVKLAMSCRTRIELLQAQLKEKQELQATFKEYLAHIVVTEEQSTAQLPEVQALVSSDALSITRRKGELPYSSGVSVASEAPNPSPQPEHPSSLSSTSLTLSVPLSQAVIDPPVQESECATEGSTPCAESNLHQSPELPEVSQETPPREAVTDNLLDTEPVTAIKPSDSPIPATDHDLATLVEKDGTTSNLPEAAQIVSSEAHETVMSSPKQKSSEALTANTDLAVLPSGSTVDAEQDSATPIAVEVETPASSHHIPGESTSDECVSRKRSASGELCDSTAKRQATGLSDGVVEDVDIIDKELVSTQPLDSESAKYQLVPKEEDISESVSSAEKTPTTLPEPEDVTSQVKLLEEPTKISTPSPQSVDPTVRIAFTAIDHDTRLSLVELCSQMPDFRLVESAEDATHIVCTRLIRTPKTYLAVALGRALVTPKWIQASVMRGLWLDETPWLLKDPEGETQLGVCLSQSIKRARRRQMLGVKASLFGGLEFWLSPGACHREICAKLIRASGGVVRQKRPTQKMALLPQPKHLIICHEDDSHVANYLMRIKTGNKAVHHEEFVLSGVLRQELDYESYQIQYVNTLQTSLKAAVAAAEAALAGNGSPPLSTPTSTPTTPRFGAGHMEFGQNLAPRRVSHVKTEHTSGNAASKVSEAAFSLSTSSTAPVMSLMQCDREDFKRSLHAVAPATTTYTEAFTSFRQEAQHPAASAILSDYGARREQVTLVTNRTQATSSSVSKSYIGQQHASTSLQHLLTDPNNDPTVSLGKCVSPHRQSLARELGLTTHHSQIDSLQLQSSKRIDTSMPCSSSIQKFSLPSASSTAAETVNLFPYDADRSDPSMTCEPQFSPRSRPTSLILSGLSSSTNLSHVSVSHRPVTALTAMIVAAEEGSNDLVPGLPLGNAEDSSVGSFILPKATTFRAHTTATVSASSIVGSSTSGLNARSAAADAHAVATATAAAASALSSSDRKSSNVTKDSSNLPLPGVRSPRSTLPSNLFSAVISDTKKRLTNIQPISVGLQQLSSLANLSSVTSLITGQLNFQIPPVTSELANLIQSYSSSTYNEPDQARIHDDVIPCEATGPSRSPRNLSSHQHPIVLRPAVMTSQVNPTVVSTELDNSSVQIAVAGGGLPAFEGSCAQPDSSNLSTVEDQSAALCDPSSSHADEAPSTLNPSAPTISTHLAESSSSN